MGGMPPRLLHRSMQGGNVVRLRHGRVGRGFGHGAVAGHLRHHRLQHGRIEMRMLLDGAQQHQPVGNHVDPARNTARCLIEIGEHLPIERRVSAPADMPQAMFDIGLDFLGLHRLQVMRGDHPLA